jgi:hypothetical protein
VARCWAADSGNNTINSVAGARFFARQSGGDLGSPDEGLREIQDVDGEMNRGKSISSTVMELNSQIVEEESEDEEENDALFDEGYRRKQEEIQRELDSRTGRVWKDPWEIEEEQWMGTASLDDLPDWSPEFVSRISQERVKLHPGKYN